MATTYHTMVEPLGNEVVQKFGVDQLPVHQVEGPERAHYKLQKDTETDAHTYA